MNRTCLIITPPLLLVACVSQPGLPLEISRHLEAPQTIVNIPKPVMILPPLPQPSAPAETYSIIVNNLPVADLLFALARDAKINVDIHPAITGNVTINAINQTLPQIMDRVTQQVNIRWTLERGVLNVLPDTAYSKTYTLDYLNVARSVAAYTRVNSSVASINGSSTGNESSGAVYGGFVDNQFWERLEHGLCDLILGSRRNDTALEKQLDKKQKQQELKKIALKDGRSVLQVEQEISSGKFSDRVDLAKQLSTAGAGAAQLFDRVTGIQTTATPATTTTTANTSEESCGGYFKKRQIPKFDSAENTSSDSAANDSPKPSDVIIHPETGLVVVNAPKRVQKTIEEFLSRLSASARRQVLIEATIVEVTLKDEYQAGMDWNKLTSSGNWGLSIAQQTIANNFATAPLTSLTLSKGSFNATVKMLEQFGRTRVLSSPKIMALNNQPAMMKIVEQLVYFTLNVTPGSSSSNGTVQTAYASMPHTASVGLSLQVISQIAADGMISLNVRPTITNVAGYVDDPAVALASSSLNQSIKSQIPVLQVREFDSTLKVYSGQIAVLGGLIQDAIDNHRQGIPGLSRLPGLGDLFSYRDDKLKKTELVIFLRPVLVQDASLNGDLHGFKPFLPDDQFFNKAQDQNLSAFRSGSVPTGSMQ